MKKNNYKKSVFSLGISGSVASGKNIFAEIFAKNFAEKNQLSPDQILIFDADFEVHQIYQTNQIVKNKIAEIFPEALIKNQIIRSEIAKIVFEDEKKLALLQEIIHPEVQKKYQNLLEKIDEKTRLIILNIPLLFENNNYHCNSVISIIVDEEIQKKRFVERVKKTSQNQILTDQEIEEKFYKIKKNQISDEERIKKSDFVIYNNSSIQDFEQSIIEIIDKILAANSF
jgi:dephospho-CoA kinase